METTRVREESRWRPATKDVRAEEWRKKRQKEAFKITVESNGGFCLPATGADALNTAARDDTDRMRQTDRRMVCEARRHSAESGRQIHMDSASCVVSRGPSLQYTGLWLACQMQHSINSPADKALQLDIYSQPMERFTCLTKYELGLIH